MTVLMSVVVLILFVLGIESLNDQDRKLHEADSFKPLESIAGDSLMQPELPVWLSANAISC